MGYASGGSCVAPYVQPRRGAVFSPAEIGHYAARFMAVEPPPSGVRRFLAAATARAARAPVSAWAVLAALVAFAIFLARACVGWSFTHDWVQFNALSLVVRSHVLSYRRFPVQNPWICGGLDILANPQNRVFSPLFLLDLAFPPQWANLLTLIVYAVVGFAGAYALLRDFELDRAVALVGAAMFINSGWFALHFTAGHIAYGSMQLLPLVLYLARHADRRREVALLGLVHALFLLDGGIYTFIFSLMMLATALAFGIVPRAVVRAAVLRAPGRLALVALAALLLATPKILPVVWEIGDRTPILDAVDMPGGLMVRALLLPFHQFSEPPGGSLPFLMHEYGCYLSIPGLLLVIAGGTAPRAYLRACAGLLGAALLWLWIGCGWWPAVNPWRLFQKLPLFNNAHVEPRVFLILYVFFVVLVARALQRLRARSAAAFAAVALLLVAESIAVRSYPMVVVPHENVRAPTALIHNDTIATTRDFAWEPPHYYDGVGAAGCYEVEFLPRFIKSASAPGYRGEAYPVDPGAGSVKLLHYTPGRITIAYDLKRPTPIELNTNALYGWRADPPASAKVTGRGTELLRVEPSALSGTVELRYWPGFMGLLFVAYAAGIALFAVLLGGLRLARRPRAGNHSRGEAP